MYEAAIPKGARGGYLTETARQSAANGATGKIEFSVLITCYYEERSIEEFYSRLSKALQGLGRSYEIIFVNDGSRDRTWDKLKQIYYSDEHVHAVVDFFRNAGQEAAITAASLEARGRTYVLMDSDLQLLPEELPLLIREYDKGFDLVTGFRVNRKDSLFRIVPSYLANIIMRRASRSHVRDFGCTFKIYNGDLLRAFHYSPRHIFSNVDLIRQIDRIVEVPVSHRPRKYGKSGWTFSKLMRYNVNNLVILSERPFQFTAFLCGLLIILFVIRLLMNAFLPFKILPYVTTGLLLNVIVMSLLIIVGLLSFIGELVIRCYVIAHDAPRYIIREALVRDYRNRDRVKEPISEEFPVTSYR